MIDNETYEAILKLAVDRAPALLERDPAMRTELDVGLNFAPRLFDVVLAEGDRRGITNDVEAVWVSDVAYEVAYDIVHGDILGL